MLFSSAKRVAVVMTPSASAHSCMGLVERWTLLGVTGVVVDWCLFPQVRVFLVTGYLLQAFFLLVDTVAVY